MSQRTLKEKLEAVKNLVDECLVELGTSAKKSARVGSDIDHKERPAKDISLQIVNKIGECDESDAIQKHVLDKRSAEGKILLCFYISHKYFENEWLETGHIEKITAELGIKIDRRNATNYLIEFRKYLESGAARKKGQPTPYRLNRKGVKRFEEIINEKET